MQTWLQFPRCFVAVEKLQPGGLVLSKAEGRHLARVRRIGTGHPVSVLNGLGDVGCGVIHSVDRDRVEIELQDILHIPPPQPEITLLIGALKQSAWDEMLKHAVELGVNRIIRIQSDHAVSEMQGEKREKKAQRWGECMTEACKQSGNPWWPVLEFADHVEQACDSVRHLSGQYFASMGPDARTLTELRQAQHPNSLGNSLGLWVGPEGDFSAREYEQILAAGAVQISLGPRVLRAETAALGLLARCRL